MSTEAKRQAAREGIKRKFSEIVATIDGGEMALTIFCAFIEQPAPPTMSTQQALACAQQGNPDLIDRSRRAAQDVCRYMMLQSQAGHG